jgi:aspartyl aminopeptidase
MNQTIFNQEFFEFLHQCPTPFHTSSYMANGLTKHGFISLQEGEEWQLQPENGYYCIRDDGSIIGFRTGSTVNDASPWRITGAHTDSPSLQIKPSPIRDSHSLRQLCVEVYGGPLLTTWFDRDLGIAGRISLLDEQENILCRILDFKRAMAIIPSLAIHLDRTANKDHSVSKQKQLFPLLCHSETDQSFEELLIAQLLVEYPDLLVKQVLGYDLFCYDTQGPSFVGSKQEFITASRLDNLVSCFVAYKALLQKDSSDNCLLLCSNHEEIGSSSFAGAQGNFLVSLFERILPDNSLRQRALSQSYFLSLDNAHALHPNFVDKHDPQHLPLLNEGPVLKYNSNQRYASTSKSAALYQYLCSEAGVPIQKFVMNNDLACGSTIGPIAASTLGVQTVDIGVPSLAMHSIRETTGSNDPYLLYKSIAHYYSRPQLPPISA